VHWVRAGRSSRGDAGARGPTACGASPRPECRGPSTEIAACASLSTTWNAYPDGDPSRPVKPNENAAPSLAPPPPAGLDPVKLMVDGEHFVVTRRPRSPGTYDFDWTSHPESYGFTVGATLSGGLNGQR
jgi:hypothetical protein